MFYSRLTFKQIQLPEVSPMRSIAAGTFRAFSLIVALSLLPASLAAQSRKPAGLPLSQDQIGRAEASRGDHAETIPVRDMVSMPFTSGNHEKPLRVLPRAGVTAGAAPATDPALQPAAVTLAAPSVGAVSSFDAVGLRAFRFTPNAAP